MSHIFSECIKWNMWNVWSASDLCFWPWYNFFHDFTQNINCIVLTQMDWIMFYVSHKRKVWQIMWLISSSTRPRAWLKQHTFIDLLTLLLIKIFIRFWFSVPTLPYRYLYKGNYRFMLKVRYKLCVQSKIEGGNNVLRLFSPLWNYGSLQL